MIQIIKMLVINLIYYLKYLRYLGHSDKFADKDVISLNHSLLFAKLIR